jgi:hypothetical protein
MKKGSFAVLKQNGRQAGLRTAIALALIGFTGSAFADPPVTMAPPVDAGYSQPADDSSSDSTAAGQDSVFQWQEVPADQKVPIRRAVFDQGGYQLYDTQGETIVIPFTDNNLYVMKFALSTDGTTYFVNGGDAPILYVPRNGYLENATVPGARWFPFSEDFHPAEPVFLGIAPSWDDYINMGWYPDMGCYGGYWSYNPYYPGSVFFASFGLWFDIGGHHYDGWGSYHHYYDGHSAPYHITVFNRNIYRFNGRNYRQNEVFRGTGHPYEVNRNSNNGHQFAENHGANARSGFGGGRDMGEGRIFRGTGHPTYAHRDYPGSRDVPDSRTTNSGSDRTFSNDRGTQGSRSTFSGGFGHSSTNAGTDHSFSNSGGTTHIFRGGESQSGSGGGHDSSNAERSNNGGNRPTFSGGFSHTGGSENPSAQRSVGGDRPSGGGERSGGGDHSGGGDRSSGGGDHSGGGGGDHSGGGGGGDHSNSSGGGGGGDHSGGGGGGGRH